MWIGYKLFPSSLRREIKTGEFVRPEGANGCTSEILSKGSEVKLSSKRDLGGGLVHCGDDEVEGLLQMGTRALGDPGLGQAASCRSHSEP